MSRRNAATTILVASIAAAFVAAVACSKDPAVAKRDLVKRGDQYVAQKKNGEAIVEYRRAISLDPRFGEARLKLAELYLQASDIQNAHREYVRAADLMPENVD